MNPEAFYDARAEQYHLLFPDWEASIARQATQLDSIIRSEWGDGIRRIHDVACGIGTQALGLASVGYEVWGSDIAGRAVERARREAAARGLSIEFEVRDMRQPGPPGAADLVIACDNSIPHLLSDAEIQSALATMRTGVRPGGCCLLTVRDYDREPRDAPTIKPYPIHVEGGVRQFFFQSWEWEGDQYILSMYLIIDDGTACRASVTRTRYYAISVDRLMELMRAAGFEAVRRIDDAFYQPVVVGTNPAA